jgi:hypothetical protein
LAFSILKEDTRRFSLTRVVLVLVQPFLLLWFRLPISMTCPPLHGVHPHFMEWTPIPQPALFARPQRCR